MSTNPLKMAIPSLREFVISPEGQEEIRAFMEERLGLINDPVLYAEYCVRAQAAWKAFPASWYGEFCTRTATYRREGSPGHDAAHWDREFLNVMAIRHDPTILKARYPVEIDTGTIGALGHDLGTTLIHRYTDRNYPMGHCEIGAWLVWHLLGDLEENMRMLIWYAINGHQHYLKDTPITDGSYFRRHHVVEPIITYTDEKKTTINDVVGIAPYMTRTADRMENLGSTHAIRHLLAQSDAQEQSNPVEWDGVKEVETKGGQAVVRMLQPEFRTIRSGSATLFDWIIGVYGHSTHGAAPYSTLDRHFPLVDYLIDRKLGQVYALLDLLDDGSIPARFSEKSTERRFKALLRRASNTPYLERSWKHLKAAWDTLDLVKKAKWSRVISHLDRTCQKGLLLVLEHATAGETDDWIELAVKVYQEVR